MNSANREQLTEQFRLKVEKYRDAKIAALRASGKYIDVAVANDGSIAVTVDASLYQNHADFRAVWGKAWPTVRSSVPVYHLNAEGLPRTPLAAQLVFASRNH